MICKRNESYIVIADVYELLMIELFEEGGYIWNGVVNFVVELSVSKYVIWI